MKVNEILYLIVCLLIFPVLFACSPENLKNDIEDLEKKEVGIAQITFNYYITYLPKDRVKRADLSIAYSADSVYKGQFFDSANVSDSISIYNFELPPGIYYYRASVVCLCDDDSCKIAGFQGKHTQRQTASKFQVKKGQVLKYNTQFQ